MGFQGLIRPTEILPAPSSGRSDRPMLAEVTPYWEYAPQDIRWVRNDSKSQAKIRQYDRSGPGIVGAMLDIPSGLAAHVRLVMQKRTPGGQWENTDDPAAHAILSLWQGQQQDQIGMYQQLIRLLDGPGELAQIIERDLATGKWYYRLLSTTNVSASQVPGNVVVRTRPNARPGSRWYQELNGRFVQHYHYADPEWPDEPWSKMHRVLPHVETYRKAMRTVGRNLDSQLAMNGIMWAEATAKSGTNWLAAYSEWARKAVDHDDGPESVVPFPMQTVSEPKWIDVGRAKHEDQLLVADFAVKEIARSSDLPTLMVTEGPGSANHWNEIAISDWVADFTMYHRNVAAVGMITKGHWRPWARALDLFVDDPNQYRVWFDDSRIRGDTDNSDDVYKLREMGIATRKAAAEVANLRPDQIMELPDGISEYEAWLIARNPGTYDAPVVDQPVDDGREPAALPDGPPVMAALPPARPAGWGDLIPSD